MTRVGRGRVRGMLPAARFGDLGLKTIGGGFPGFGPQNPGGGSDAERTARGGIGKIARSKATGEAARWSSDQKLSRV